MTRFPPADGNELGDGVWLFAAVSATRKSVSVLRLAAGTHVDLPLSTIEGASYYLIGGQATVRGSATTLTTVLAPAIIFLVVPETLTVTADTELTILLVIADYQLPSGAAAATSVIQQRWHAYAHPDQQAVTLARALAVPDGTHAAIATVPAGTRYRISAAGGRSAHYLLSGAGFATIPAVGDAELEPGSRVNLEPDDMLTVLATTEIVLLDLYAPWLGER